MEEQTVNGSSCFSHIPQVESDQLADNQIMCIFNNMSLVLWMYQEKKFSIELKAWADKKKIGLYTTIFQKKKKKRRKGVESLASYFVFFLDVVTKTNIYIINIYLRKMFP